MDLFSDAVHSLRMREFRAGISERRAPWGTYYPQNSWDVVFYAIGENPCWLSVDGLAEPLYLPVNSICILPHGHGHALRDDPATPAQPILHLRPPGYYGLVHYGSADGALTRVYLGHFRMNRVGRNPFWEALPPVIHMQPATAPSWLNMLFGWFREELSGQATGYQAMVGRIAELLILQSVRLHLTESPSGPIAALNDPQLYGTLALIHARGERRWTVESLAAAVGTSRSRLAARFSAHFGEGPLHYLARWRLHKAAVLLTETDLKIARIVEMVGYQSEPSFNIAFKKANGITPGRYRVLARHAISEGSGILERS
jgi:AraC-like DNA-binding protein